MKISKASIARDSTWARLKFAASFGVCCLGACLLVLLASHEHDALRRSLSVASTKTLRLPEAEPPATVHRRRKLSPSDIVSKIGSQHAKGSLWKNDHNIVHVINTRFLQHQSKLVHLQTARLDLFKTFTLPSLLQQTNRQFLWLIWTGAEQTPLRKELGKLLQKVPNVVLIGLAQDKNSNFRQLYGHSWADLSAAVLSGHHKLLADYYSASKTRLLLETRLDADDALSATFVESMQAQAGAAMGHRARPNQKEVYCPESHIEWRYYSGDDEVDNDKASSGKLFQYRNENFCIFSGLTWAHNVERDDAKQGRALQQGGNNGNACAIRNDTCTTVRQLESLFETEVIHPTRRARANSDFYGDGPIPSLVCDYVFVACYECGQSLECFAAPEGGVHPNNPAYFDPVLNWLKGTHHPRDWPFCESGHTCNGQMCGGGVESFLVGRDQHPNTCPIIGTAQCPVSGKDLTSFATYKVFLCYGDPIGSVDLDEDANCGTKCDSGTCPCEYGSTDFCTACDGGGDDDDDDDDKGTCRRQLRLLPAEEEDVTATKTQYDSSVPAASVLLARTPTAAGMKNVVPSTKGGGQNSIRLDDVVVDWDTTARGFGVGWEAATALRERLEGNMENILIDAFAGQCTPGHSCKESTKRSLGLLLDQVQRRNKN